jgi:hypothetical protein
LPTLLRARQSIDRDDLENNKRCAGIPVSSAAEFERVLKRHWGLGVVDGPWERGSSSTARNLSTSLGDQAGDLARFGGVTSSSAAC